MFTIPERCKSTASFIFLKTKIPADMENMKFDKTDKQKLDFKNGNKSRHLYYHKISNS